MRKGIVLFLTSFFISQFAYAGAPAGLSAQDGRDTQKKEVDPYEWDFGKVKEGVISKHDFVLKNQTSSILEINSIHTSCGCTTAESDKKSLLPQESAVIKVTFSSQGYSSSISSFVPITQFIYVDTNNKDLAIIKYTIKVQVVKD